MYDLFDLYDPWQRLIWAIREIIKYAHVPTPIQLYHLSFTFHLTLINH
jgi:hypothetical protein